MAEKHFFEQQDYTTKYFLHYLKKNIDIVKGREFKILEIGCAEGGFLAVMHDNGFAVKGVEISEGRVAIAKEKLVADIEVVVGDVSDASTLDFSQQYDLVILRDVIEHVSDQQAALDNIHKLVKKGGDLFITFPLKFSPYAGHQQTAKSGLKYVWFITLFPQFMIKGICNFFNEPSQYKDILYLKKHALTYSRLKRMMSSNSWEKVVTDFFISRPVFMIRFGWRIVKMPNIIVLRGLSTGCELLLRKPLL